MNLVLRSESFLKVFNDHESFTTLQQFIFTSLCLVIYIIGINKFTIVIIFRAHFCSVVTLPRFEYVYTCIQWNSDNKTVIKLYFSNLYFINRFNSVTCLLYIIVLKQLFTSNSYFQAFSISLMPILR